MKTKNILLMSAACIIAMPMLALASCLADLPYVCHAANAGHIFRCPNTIQIIQDQETEGDIKWASLVNGNGYSHNDYFNTTCDWDTRSQTCANLQVWLVTHHHDTVSESYSDGNRCGEW
jgi:hypothetical protein